MNTRVAGTLVYTGWGLCTLFFWLLFGQFAIAMRERSAVPSATELLRQFNASDTVISLLIAALPAAISMLIGPVISYRSDRYRGKRGRRIPFLLWQTPLTALAMAGIGMAPLLGRMAHAFFGAASPGLDVCVLSIFALFWTIFDVFAIMSIAIFTGLVNDIVPGGLQGRFYSGVRVISLGTGILFNTLIFPLTETHLMEIFVGIGLLFGIGTMLMCFKLEEGSYQHVAAPAASFGATAAEYFRECFSSSYYVTIFAALMFATIAPTPFTTFSQVYAGQLGMSKAELGNLLALSFAISIGMAFLIGSAVDRYSALKVTTLMMLFYGSCSFGGYVLVDSGAQHFRVAYMGHVVISGAFYTAVASLPMRLFPQERFMQFNSAAIMLAHGASLLVSTIQGPLLDYSNHNYKLTLLFGGCCAFCSVVLLLKVRANLARAPIKTSK